MWPSGQTSKVAYLESEKSVVIMLTVLVDWGRFVDDVLETPDWGRFVDDILETPDWGWFVDDILETPELMV